MQKFDARSTSMKIGHWTNPWIAEFDGSIKFCISSWNNSFQWKAGFLFEIGSTFSFVHLFSKTKDC